jgi:hypothetical protein
VTGPTGSGKSTTLAAMIDRISIARPAHIPTIEDRSRLHRTSARLSISAAARGHAGLQQRACVPRSAKGLTSCSSAKCAT